MKKLLSILLAMAMVLGIGVCGTVGARAAKYDNLRLEEQMEILTTVLPVLAYFQWEGSMARIIEAEAGLNPGYTFCDISGTTEWLAFEDFEKKYGFFDYDAFADAYVNGTLFTEIEQVLPAIGKLFSDCFTTTFLTTTFYPYRDAFAGGFSQYLLLAYLYEEGPEKIANINELREDCVSLEAWIQDVYNDSRIGEDGRWHYGDNGLEKTGSFADLTNFFLDMQVRAKAILDRVKFADTTPEPPEKWWQKVPNWVQWILRYLLFGWLWMNW